MACTAWVASRPEYCFNRRSTESGTVSSTSRVDLGGTNRLSVMPKSYAVALSVSSNEAASGDANEAASGDANEVAVIRRRPGPTSAQALPVSLYETPAAITSSIWYLRAASTATD
jgi:hypothetical protein